MNYLKYLILSGIILGFGVATLLHGVEPQKAGTANKVPTPDMVTMVDLGAKKCIPCKMMAPILEELQKEYAGRASIVFIDVWENPAEAERFAVRSIPTQIFYDKTGKEVGRHTGFLDKKSIISALNELGVPEEAGR
ncbi:MAG: thioredoxin domain-containing protein [Desulfobacterales bacterium]